jgi:hypothetical protein
MMHASFRWVLHAHVLACAVAAGSGTHAASLQHDLFERPPLEALKPVQPQTVKTVTPAPPPAEWKPELRAIITGSGTAMVNVEGRIVQMGQEIDGYRLAEVRERHATFIRDKVRYTLYLNPVRAADAPPVAVKAADAPSAIGHVRTSDVISKGSPSAPDARRTTEEPKKIDRSGG